MGVATTIIFQSAMVSELWPIFQIVVMAEFYVLRVDKIRCYHHTHSLTMKTYPRTLESSLYVLKLQRYHQNRTLK
jgi:hypothetical protein